MKKSWFVLFVFCSVNIFQGCSSSKTSSQDKTSPFAGIWNFVYEGIYSGSTEFKIDQEGRFEAAITVKNDVRTFTNDIHGEVNELGTF
jgi:hypothetical protein